MGARKRVKYTDTLPHKRTHGSVRKAHKLFIKDSSNIKISFIFDVAKWQRRTIDSIAQAQHQ